MNGTRTRGHPAALGAIEGMIRAGAPGAVLFVGPAGVGKTTLAQDLAAGLLCQATAVEDRPDGTCRACRLVAHGTHPDLHLLRPEGPGRQVVIGGRKARGVRDLIAELALLPVVEGGARVAIIAEAERMNEEAQGALLKTLEEPPAGTTIILCADAEEPIPLTIRSRCARIRLGPVGVRDIETILSELDAADPPLSARLARIADGRPGLALAWARRPDALRERDALGRALLDLAAARPSDRLSGIRSVAAAAVALAPVAEARPQTDATPASSGRPGGRPGSRTRRGTSPDPAAPEATDGDEAAPDDAAPPARAPALERRRSAEAVVSLWSEVTRDLMLCQLGLQGSVRDLARLDETNALAADLDPDALTGFLDRLGRATVLLATNVSPELVLDDLALAFPRPAGRAAA